MDSKEKEILQELKKLNKKVSDLDKRLEKHISFIEQVYNPLTDTIDKVRKIFRWHYQKTYQIGSEIML